MNDFNFTGDTEMFVYFFGPVGILLLINLILFLATTRELTCGLWKKEAVKSTTERLLFLTYYYLGTYLLLKCTQCLVPTPERNLDIFPHDFSSDAYEFVPMRSLQLRIDKLSPNAGQIL